MVTLNEFSEWAAECNRRGFKGPYKLASRPLNSWQYLGDSGTAAMWNGEHARGYIFDDPSGSATGEP